MRDDGDDKGRIMTGEVVPPPPSRVRFSGLDVAIADPNLRSQILRLGPLDDDDDNGDEDDNDDKDIAIPGYSQLAVPFG